MVMVQQISTKESARLYWQCRRGMLELDTLLLGFLEQGYDALDEDGRQGFLELLDYPDTELLEYLMGRQSHKEVRLRNVIEAIRSSACR
jgi:antitoxin CptB